MKEVIKALGQFSSALDTPIIRLVSKGFWIALFAIGVYAARAYLHEAISGDEIVRSMQTDITSTKTLVIAHDTFVKEQSDTNTKLSEFFRESRASRDEMTKQLSAILQHGVDQDQRLDRIERKLDK